MTGVSDASIPGSDLAEHLESAIPAVFIGHGSPMNALESNRYTSAWSDLASAIGAPRAILAISAHWYIGATAVTAMDNPRTIHDFYGFPPELFAFEYPAPGAPELAKQVAELASPIWVGLDYDSWGIDHGTWSVLAHMFPRADVPVVQLSIDATKPFEYHLELGRRIAPLRERGVLVVASGNVVHNLQRIDWHQPFTGFDWARRFDDAVRNSMVSSPGSVIELSKHPDFAFAAPTPDHFIPLLYLAGIAEVAGTQAEMVMDGFAYGSLSMAAYRVGLG